MSSKFSGLSNGQVVTFTEVLHFGLLKLQKGRGENKGRGMKNWVKIAPHPSITFEQGVDNGHDL